MTHISPAVNLIWALLSTALGSFLIFHLWSFDRFNCLRWNHGPHSGAFKRIMTYSYLLSVPLIIVYSVGFTTIKYTYGFTAVPLFGIIPTPYELWSTSAQSAILPLYLCYSFAWGLEMVTHLEELCFWLFLVNASSTRQDWFRSAYFKIWAVGSCIAVIVMPLVTIFTRQDVYKCEAFTVLTGGIGSLLLTLGFLPVLWVFPSFLDNLKQLDVEKTTQLRLTKFHELNCIRVVFRFLFTVPLVILGADGVRHHRHINDKMFPTDFLAIVAGIGCVVSSGLTLIIFFPRSLRGEMTRKEQQQAQQRQRPHDQDQGRYGDQYPDQQRDQEGWNRSHGALTGTTDVHSYVSITQAKSDVDLTPVDRYPSEGGCGLPAYEVVTKQDRRVPTKGKAAVEDMSIAKGDKGAAGEICEMGTVGKGDVGKKGNVGDVGKGDTGAIALQPNRRMATGDIELGGVLSVSEVELLRARSRREHAVSSLVYHWRSPIEIGRPMGASWQRRVGH